MKLSGPGLLCFFGRFLITVSILALVSRLFIFSVSPRFSLGRLCLSENLSVSSRLSNLLAHSSFLWHLLFYGISCNFFFFISYWFESTLLFFVMNLTKNLSNVYFFKEPAFSFIDLCSFLFLYFIYFCSNLYDFFTSSNFRFCLFFSLIVLGVMLHCLLEVFLVSWGKIVLL